MLASTRICSETSALTAISSSVRADVRDSITVRRSNIFVTVSPEWLALETTDRLFTDDLAVHVADWVESFSIRPQ